MNANQGQPAGGNPAHRAATQQEQARVAQLKNEQSRQRQAQTKPEDVETDEDEAIEDEWGAGGAYLIPTRMHGRHAA